MHNVDPNVLNPADLTANDHLNDKWSAQMFVCQRETIIKLAE